MREIAAKELLQHTDFVRRVALALCKDEHGADDLVQDTWVTALTRGWPDSSGLRSWLAGVARNLARQGRRGATRRDAREAAAARAEGQPATDDVVERMETHRHVVSAILQLPESSREIVLLRYFDGLAPRVIAERLELPVETVRTRVKRARLRLREVLGEQHGSHAAYLVALTDLGRRGGPSASDTAASSTAAAPAIAKVGMAGVLTAAAGFVAWPLLSVSPEATNEVTNETASISLAETNSATVPAQDVTPGLTRAPRREPNSGAAGSFGERRPATKQVEKVPGTNPGTLIVRDVDGRTLEHESGHFYLRRVHGTQGEAQLVSFSDGHFTFEGTAQGTVQIERATALADDAPRPIAFESAQLEHTPGQPLVVSGFFLPDSTLRVVDARTGAPIDRVRVLPGQGSPDRSHPGPHTSSAFCIKDKPSPVLLPGTRWIRPYWVTAPGYTWSFLTVDHETGGEREVRLEPAGRLEVQTAGHDPELALFLRVYRYGTREVAASCTLDCSPRRTAFQGFDGLAPGEYDVRVEIGLPADPPQVVAEARAVVPVGGKTKVTLDTTGYALPPVVDVHGELILPQGHEGLELTLILKPASTPMLRKQDTQRIPRGSMMTTDKPGVLSWYGERLSPGRYIAVVQPIQYGVLLDVPSGSFEGRVDGLRIEVPQLYPITVRAVDERTGEPVETATLSWTREMPPEAGADAWSHFGVGLGPDSSTLLAPEGTIFLAGSGPSHGQQQLNGRVGPGANEFTLELPPQIPLEVILKDGDTLIPWDPGMTCTYRRRGVEESRPCESYGKAKMLASIDEPGQYEILVGPLDGFRQPAPVAVTIDGASPARVIIALER